MPPVERHLRVPRTARFFQLGTAGPAARELWIACHGYGQLAAPFASALEVLDDGHRVIVAPEALSRFYLDDPVKRHGPDSPIGASWMTRDDRESEIADYVEYLDRLVTLLRDELPVAAPVVALGFSQGVATVCRWAAFGQTPIARLVLWGGPVPSDLPGDRATQLFRGAAVTIVSGRADRLVPPSALEKERAALAARGIRADFVMHEGGHALNSLALRELASRFSTDA